MPESTVVTLLEEIVLVGNSLQTTVTDADRLRDDLIKLVESGNPDRNAGFVIRVQWKELRERFNRQKIRFLELVDQLTVKLSRDPDLELAKLASDQLGELAEAAKLLTSTAHVIQSKSMEELPQ